MSFCRVSTATKQTERGLAGSDADDKTWVIAASPRLNLVGQPKARVIGEAVVSRL